MKAYHFNHLKWVDSCLMHLESTAPNVLDNFNLMNFKLSYPFTCPLGTSYTDLVLFFIVLNLCMTCSFLSFKFGLKWHMLKGGLSWPNHLELPSTYPMLHHQVWFSLWNSSNIFLLVDYPSPWEQEPCLSC